MSLSRPVPPVPPDFADPPGRVFGVLGHPLGQSMSPPLHSWAFAQADIPAVYTAWDTPPEALSAFMERFRRTPLGGGSVTIPHKQAVIPFLDGMTPVAETIGAVNTLHWDNNRLLGHNTDMEGFLAPLEGLPVPDSVLVLGAGGAARAVLAALASLNVPRLTVAARNKDKAETLIRDFAFRFADAAPVAWEDRLDIAPSSGRFWVINTTPVGMRGKTENDSPLPAEWFIRADADRFLAYDLVYNPLETPFLSLARAANWQCRDGLGMFIGQAAAQFHLWTGRHMDRTGARTLIANLLAA